jgi:L-cysteine S-thiosulfotransferase
MKKYQSRTRPIGLAIAGLFVLASCAALPTGNNGASDEAMQAMLKSSFRDQGQAEVSRLVQDAAAGQCSAADLAGKDIDKKAADAIESASLKTVKAPSNGQYLGDFTQGETIAQSGRGATWTDAKGSANGGNCYNCHQISKQELSFGTIGPSLYNYGKLRGVTDPTSAAAKPIVEYTWNKIMNSRAYNACSSMPRFSHLLSEDQVRHIMALLLDPKSPANQ